MGHFHACGRRCYAAIVVALLTLASTSWAKPRIMIVATGGTIAGAQADRTQAGYQAGQFKIEDLIAAAPQMKELAELTGERVVNIGSQTLRVRERRPGDRGLDPDALLTEGEVRRAMALGQLDGREAWPQQASR